MALLLNTIPGFADLPDSVLEAGDPAFGLHVEAISSNAAFGMERCEVFQKIYYDGETVDLPVSPIDDYHYSREELMYCWVVKNSGGKDDGEPAGPDTLWFCNWDVDQTTGVVSSTEWYRRSGDHLEANASHDGHILVYTVAQRQLTTIIVATPPTFAALDEADIDVDKPLTEELAQGLNEDAKFCVLNREVFYMGEFVNGDTVGTPTSPADSYAYDRSECIYMFSWRWTTKNDTYKKPAEVIGQMGPFHAEINQTTGAVTVWVKYIDNDGAVVQYNDHGRIAVHAFCTRADTPATAPLADDFQEIDYSLFVPGHTLRASSVLAVKKNIDEALMTPEFFGPTDYQDGDTIPLPTSTVDGYSYARSELTYIATWADTTNHTGAHLRLPLFRMDIEQATGDVTLNTFQLPPGGPIYDDVNNLCSITVLVMARRQAASPTALSDTPTPGASDITTGTSDGVAYKEIDIPSTAGGSFTAAHGIAGEPFAGIIHMTSDGSIWWQSTRWDSTNLNLIASQPGCTAKIVLLYTTGGA